MALHEKNKIDLTFDWGDVKNLGMFTYLMSKSKDRSDSLVQVIRKDLVFIADSLSAQGRRDVFGRTLGRKYWWGCNGALARQTLILYMANRVSPDKKYIDAAVDITDHLFGRNIYGRSYVTGLGHLPPLNPHDRRSGGDGVEPPWPGYLVGGGESATDWHDEERDFRTSEICINWQAALVYTLTWISELQ
jgi:endoglucanase